MKVEIMEVTPALAREWLGLNTNNRSVRRTVVERYKGDIERGEWQLNGEAIVLNGGSLLDGQHRLLACVEANKKFKSVVVFDAPGSAMQTIDQGVSRSLADVLKWRGYTDTNKLAAAIRMGWRWDNGKMLSASAAPSIAQAVEWMNENERIVSATKFAARLTGNPIRLSSAVGSPIYLKALNAEEDAATEFFDRLLDGEHIAHGNAVYALRRTLITNAQRTHAKMLPNTMMAFTIRAWNAWIMNEPLERLMWRRSDRQTRFPVMVDSAGDPISVPQ